MMIDAVLPRFVQDKRACASTQLIKMRVHARHNSGSDVRHEKTLKFAEGKIVPGLGLPMFSEETRAGTCLRFTAEELRWIYTTGGTLLAMIGSKRPAADRPG